MFFSDIIFVIMNEISSSIAAKVKARITKGPKGKLYFVSSFEDLQNDSIVTRTLSRLEKGGIIVRLSKSIYLYPETNRFGIVYPSLNKIAKIIAERDKADIMPTGNEALNLLGLSTQVPMNAVYLTTGTPRIVKIGNRKITFKHSVPKNFAYKSTLIPLIVFALKSLKEKNVDEMIQQQIKALMDHADTTEKQYFVQDIMLAPQWIKNQLISNLNN